MPFHYRYDPERDLLLQVGHGPIDLDDVAALRRARREDGIPHPVKLTVIDLREVKLSMDAESMRNHEQSAPASDFPGGRNAVLTSGPRVTALAMMWKQWRPGGMDVEVFSTLEAAAGWLGVPIDESELDF